MSVVVPVSKQPKMMLRRFLFSAMVVTAIVSAGNLSAAAEHCGGPRPRRILVDTDVNTDDLFALLYLLKLSRSEFDLQAITINSNTWTNAGHAVNQIYDLLYMMDRDDVAVGVGGEGGILEEEDGTILPNVGGYLPIIEQRIGTAGYCRYRQAIPVGQGGRLDLDTNYGFRKSFLPQGNRQYTPLRQPTAQQVMVDKISAGPTTVFIIGAHTNFALFLMKNPHLRKNVEHVYVMGGGVRSQNPTGCCPKNGSSPCQPRQCGDHGNLFTDYASNPYAEFNIFGDPYAAYQVIHSGIPVTLVPLDATNTIPINEKFFEIFEKNQDSYEAQYSFKSLKMARDTWFDDQFYTSYFMWDSFAFGIATSIMSNSRDHRGENEFSEMEFMNITVVTSNQPYGVSDGSNPLFDGRKNPKFNLNKDGVHSGHVQTRVRDPFCHVDNGKGRCKVLNRPQHTARFNLTTQFPYYREVLYKPNFGEKKLGKNVLFDMDMSAGDFLALFYLLKLPVEVINLKAILVSPTGWANAATIDVVYDLLHMMGRDDIPVGLGNLFAVNQSDSVSSSVGDCKYLKAIPYGSGGFLDSDTLYGLARDLPRSPRRYTAENSVKFGAPRDTDHPELRQILALEVWENITKSLDSGSKISILTNGPLTNLADIILSHKNASSKIQDVFVVGGHISNNKKEKGNVFTVPSNEYAEFNMFLDPLAAKTVFDSALNITLIPLGVQRKVSAFPEILDRLNLTNKTSEALFTRRLISRLHALRQKHHRYQHMDMFLGEVLGALIMGADHSVLSSAFEGKAIKVIAIGVESEDGQMKIDEKKGKRVKVLESVDSMACYRLFANRLGDSKQSAVVASFQEQTRIWSMPPKSKSVSTL
ncbi:nucleoside hydrolase 3-like isoform X2 [Diospyros lotus]|uniref:nucleoside hydrolase 3-like isoform X2 n=1 Tax=Diospyros lotus TaxID=55363 RepID=UPI002254D6B7|nr:nucleoside hydrolase 3-like isoform X2 [Diospyros lotus]